MMEVMRRLGAVAAAALAVLALALSALVTPARAAAPVTTPIMITGHDLHDGTIVQDGGTFYLYGTMYKCGFEWGHKNTPFCGFGVETASSLTGPWEYRGMLFSPKALDNWGPDKGKTWDWVCGSTGAGCFNPRMLHRPDGVWLLWFNAPRDHTVYDVPAYYVMGCNGPAGPCGYQAGAPHGSTHKPELEQCNVNGDFSIITSGASAAILCSQYTLHEQALDKWWTDGTSQGGPGMAGASIPAASPDARAVIGEGVGAWQMADGTWEMVYSTPGCGYCTGPPRDKSAGGATQVQAGYSTAPSMLGPWTPGSLPGGVLSPSYCTGQPRTVFTAAGQAWEWIDQWTGSDNETAANIMLEPMSADPWSCAVRTERTPDGHR
jgi:hypothetical protein